MLCSTVSFSMWSQSTMTSLNNVNYRPPTKLQEGNVFTGVYLSTGRGRVSLVPCPFLVPGPMSFLGEGVRVSLVPCPLGVGIPYTLPAPGIPYPPHPRNNKSGRYASYWNAFLFRRCLGTAWNIDFQIHLWAHQTVFCRAIKSIGDCIKFRPKTGAICSLCRTSNNQKWNGFKVKVA